MAVAVAVLAFGATTATAHRTSFDTDLVAEDTDLDTGNRFIEVTGHVSSPNQRCEPARVVRLVAWDTDSDTRTLVDVDLTSLRGGFVVRGTYPAGTDQMLVFVARKNIGRNGHRHICERDGHGVVLP